MLYSSKIPLKYVLVVNTKQMNLYFQPVIRVE